MTEYKIKKGCSWAWPRPFGLVNVNKTDRVVFKLRLDDRSYISKEEYMYGPVDNLQLDEDYHDAHKALGLTVLSPLANNKGSIIHAYQFQANQKFGVMAYWNDTDGAIPKSFPFKSVSFEDISSLEVYDLSRNGFKWQLKINDTVVDEGAHEWKVSKWFPYVRVIGCTFGGADNSEGPLGDKSPKTIIFEAEYNRLNS